MRASEAVVSEGVAAPHAENVGSAPNSELASGAAATTTRRQTPSISKATEGCTRTKTEAQVAHGRLEPHATAEAKNGKAICQSLTAYTAQPATPPAAPPIAYLTSEEARLGKSGL